MDQLIGKVVAVLGELVTGWGIAGTLVAVFVGPVFVQRVVKPYCGEGLIGPRGSKRKAFTLGSISAALTFAASVAALMRQYDDIMAILWVAGCVALFQVSIIEWIFYHVEKRNPGLVDRLRDKDEGEVA